ncbi:MAG: GAF domain-containing sensor histidine kinase [Chloroflexota bacterium]|nr:GAF domain-containing sensor histidine kinase [Chloroflexota bacterium]
MSKLLLAYVGLEEKYELSTRQLARRAEQLRIITEVGRRILSVRHLQELLPFVARVLYETFSCYSVGVWLKEESSQQLVLGALAGGGNEDLLKELRFAYTERSVVVWVATHGEPLLINDVTTEPRYRIAPGSEPVRGELAVPIKLEGETIGVLDIEHTEVNAFDPSDQEMLATVADQVALAIENARLWEQNRQLAIIEERNRIAREIHDTLAQNLTGITLQLEAAVQLRETKPERAWDRVHKALDLAKEGLAEVRRSVRDLRPAPLESRTLQQALDDELRRVESDTGAHTELEIDADIPRLPARAEDALYRIAQEALNNVRRHANACQVRLTLERDGDHGVRLRVRDDGVGFRPEASTDPLRRSFGLTSMKERARLLGGEMEVRPGRNRGTVVEARVPIDGEAPR